MADSYWCYVKTISASGKLPSQESKLREYIDKWYELRDKHAELHPANSDAFCDAHERRGIDEHGPCEPSFRCGETAATL